MRRPLFIILTGALALNLISSDLYALGKKELLTEAVAVDFAREVVKGGYGIVRTDELKEWMAQGRPMLIVDTMPLEDSYKKAHVPGSVNFEFPVKEVEDLPADVRARYEALLGPDKGQVIVVYCGFTHCGRSHNGAMWAVKLGYKNVFRYPGGITAWKEAKNPVEKGN